MLSELTDLKLQLAALELEMKRISGDLSPSEPIPVAEYARLAGLSESTVKNVLRVALCRVTAKLLQDPDLPPHLARAAVSSLTERGL